MALVVADEVAEEVAALLVAEEELLVVPAAAAAVVATNVHCLDSWNSGSPFGPETGVMVMVHVSSIGPWELKTACQRGNSRESAITTHVWTVFCVCTVMGC